MRYIAIPSAALLLLLAASPALASPGGGAALAHLEVGPHTLSISNDSTSARIGRNTMTVEITDVPDGHSVSLKFIGPRGQVLEAPLRPLQVLSGAEEAHGDAGHAGNKEATQKAPEGTHAMTGGSHAMPEGSHAMTGGNHNTSPAPPDHGSAGNEHGTEGNSFVARASVNFPEGGPWTAVVGIQVDHGEGLEAQAPFHVTYGGPNRVFVASSGLIIGSFMLYGAIDRRRNSVGR